MSRPGSDTFLRANLAQVAVNIIFGSGAVAGAFGLTSHNAHPVVFGAIRAIICAAVLTIGVLVLERCSTRSTGTRAPPLRLLFTADLRPYILTSFFLFTGELFYILGVALAGPVRASLWQPSQPVFTLLFATCTGAERFTWRRLTGVLITTAGVVGMSVGSILVGPSGGGGDGAARSAAAGNVCLLLNCMSTPAFLLAQRPLLARGYVALILSSATFWLCSACFLCATGLSALLLTEAMGPVSWPTAQGMLGCTYIALVGTALPFPLQYFANRHLRSSLVSAYYALQPVSATALSVVVTAAGLVQIRRPVSTDLFGLGTIAGLFVVVSEERARANAVEGDARLIASNSNLCRSAAWPSARGKSGPDEERSCESGCFPTAERSV